MVSAHVYLTPYSQKTSGLSGGHLVRYLNRQEEFSPVRYVERVSDKTKDYNDFVCGDHQHLPAWAQENPGVFFAAAQTHEGPNRYFAFQVEFSLPRELSYEQQMALRHDLMEATMPDLPAMWAMHNKQLDSGEMHPHIHVLFSARRVDGIERDPAQTFRRWDRHDPANGGCEKDLFWSKNHAPEQLRQAFADISNYHLERAHVEARVDPRALKRREIQRDAIGRGSDRPDAATLAKEQRQAAQSWEQRKAYRGLADVHAIPREEMVLLVRQWTRQYERGQQLPRVSAAEVEAWEVRALRRVTQEVEALERQVGRSHAAVMRATHRERQQGYARENGGHHAPEGAPDLDRRWEHPLIGNKRSMIYHLPVSHKNYDDITPANQEVFWTERDAQAAGYRRAENEHYGTGTGQRREERDAQRQEASRTRDRAASPPGSRTPTRSARRTPGAVAPPVERPRPPGARQGIGMLQDEEDHGGLLAPNLDKKRGRDGYDW